MAFDGFDDDTERVRDETLLKLLYLQSVEQQTLNLRG